MDEKTANDKELYNCYLSLVNKRDLLTLKVYALRFLCREAEAEFIYCPDDLVVGSIP